MNTDKPILTISVASSLLKLHPRTIMLYERSALITPHRTNSKRRLFSINDLNELQFIKFLTQEKGLNILGVKLIKEAIEISRKGNINLKGILFPSFKAKKLI